MSWFHTSKLTQPAALSKPTLLSPFGDEAIVHAVYIKYYIRNHQLADHHVQDLWPNITEINL